MNPDRLISRFFRYVRCASESGSERNFCDLLEKELKALGLYVSRDCVGDRCGSDGYNLYGRLDGDGDAVLFSAHMDTVGPGNNIHPVEKAGVIYSSGDTVLGADDKAGVAAVMEALESILESGTAHKTVEVLFTVCEENGLQGARYADFSNVRSQKAIVLDNEKLGEIINRNPANMVIHFEITGKAAHAGMAPEDGIHALKAAAKAVSNIPVGYVDEITVMNISNFLSPGKTNVIADRASFDMEIRSFEEERLQRHIALSEKTVQEACGLYGASYKMNSKRHSDVIYIPEKSDLITQVQSAFARLGVKSSVVKSFGGCDATHIFANGIEVVNLGIGMQAVHSCEENISIKDLETTGKLVQMLIENTI